MPNLNAATESTLTLAACLDAVGTDTTDLTTLAAAQPAAAPAAA